MFGIIRIFEELALPPPGSSPISTQDKQSKYYVVTKPLFTYTNTIQSSMYVQITEKLCEVQK